MSPTPTAKPAPRPSSLPVARVRQPGAPVPAAPAPRPAVAVARARVAAPTRRAPAPPPRPVPAPAVARAVTRVPAPAAATSAPRARTLPRVKGAAVEPGPPADENRAVPPPRTGTPLPPLAPGEVPNVRFPAAKGPRPTPVVDEERRRLQWMQRERQRRKELLEASKEGDERRQLLHEWTELDKLYYRFDPDDVEVDLYAIQEPHAYVQILRNRRTHEAQYHIIEPKLDHEEQAFLDFIEKTLVDVLDLQPEELGGTDLETYVRERFEQVVSDYGVKLEVAGIDPDESRNRLLYYVLRDFIGEGPIQALMRDPAIEDISCDGPHVPLFVYHRKHEAMTTTIRFRDHAHLDSFVIRMAQRSGKFISIAQPILDATLLDGSRLQATLAREISTFGSTFTIRKFREIPFTPLDLVRFGTMSPQMLAYLWMAIEHHKSCIYAGGTASGKTTALNALMMFIPPQQKVVSIEDTREIRIPQPNWIAGLTRSGFGPRDMQGRQAGEIDMFQLLKNALRQRPEYIVVGEVRGQEAYSLFQAMATGHAAYGTMHADSVDAVVHRLESEPLNIPRIMLEALDIVCVQVQTRLAAKRVRKTKQMTELVAVDPNTKELLTNEVFRWTPETDKFTYSGVSYVLQRIAQETGKSLVTVQSEMTERAKLLDILVKRGVVAYDQVASVITSYYKERAKVLAQWGVK